MSIEIFDILGVPAHRVDFARAVKIASDIIGDDRKGEYIVALNAEKIMMARRNREVMRIIEDASLLIPDGVGVSLASRILYGKSVPRVPGYDFFMKLLQEAAERGSRVFLLGAKREVIEAAKDTLLDNYGTLDIVGYHHGYFLDDEEIVDLVNSATPDMLFVGMGSPRQEKWVHQHIRKLNVKLCFSVGGSFDIIAGKKKLAPPIMRRLGFEFVYRLMKEPKRLQRQLVFPNFLAALLATRTKLIR